MMVLGMVSCTFRCDLVKGRFRPGTRKSMGDGESPIDGESRMFRGENQEVSRISPGIWYFTAYLSKAHEMPLGFSLLPTKRSSLLYCRFRFAWHTEKEKGKEKKKYW